MHKYNRVAPAELIENRIKYGVAEVGTAVVGQHHEAAHLQDVERIGNLRQCSIDVWQRQACESAETTAMVLRVSRRDSLTERAGARAASSLPK
jgi:hypothetical protein